MRNVKAYKVTHTRIGLQEKWSGVQIAGRSEGIPQNSLSAFSKSSGEKGKVGTSLTKPISVFEFSEIDGSFIISKFTFGLHDMLGRLCHRSDGVVFPLTENPGLYKDPNSFLSIDKANFNLPLKELYNKISDVNDTNRDKFELKPEFQQGNNVLTIYEEPVVFSENFVLENILSKYFKNNKKRIFDFIRCVYWSVSSSIPLYIKSSFNVDEIFEIIYLVYYVLPYSLRAKLSLRTYNIPMLTPTNIIFTDTAVNNGKIYDFDNGKNNVFDSTIMENAYQKYQYINFVANNIEEPELKEYFDVLQDVMEELGVPDSTDFKFIGVAHEIVCDEEQGEQLVILRDEILKKFLDFLTLSYNNVKIDWHIAKLLEIIIDNNITLNESIQERLLVKLKITQSEQLKNIGYSYTAILMLKSKNREKEFAYLSSLRNNKNLFKLMCEKILNETDGDVFLDEFYGDYYGDLSVTNSVTLSDFVNETGDLPIKQKINAFIYRKCFEFGKKIIDDYFASHTEISIIFPKYQEYIHDKMPQQIGLVNGILRDIRLYFWENFNFENFKYADKENYLTVSFRTSNKCIAVVEFINVFDNVKSQNISTVNSFLKLLDKNKTILSDAAKYNLIKEFQGRCLSVDDKNSKIDFWYKVVNILPNESVRFILKNDITVFTDINLLLSELYDSEIFNNKAELKDFICVLDNYNQLNSEDDKVNEISKTLRQFEKSLRKKEKNDKKNEKKLDSDPLPKKKNNSDFNAKITNSYDDKEDTKKESNSFDDDFILDSGKPKNKKEKKGFLGFNFGRKK